MFFANVIGTRVNCVLGGGGFGDYIEWWSDTHLVLQRVFHRSGGLKVCPLFLPIKKMAATLRLTDVFLIVFGHALRHEGTLVSALDSLSVLLFSWDLAWENPARDTL